MTLPLEIQHECDYIIGMAIAESLPRADDAIEPDYTSYMELLKSAETLALFIQGKVPQEVV